MRPSTAAVTVAAAVATITGAFGSRRAAALTKPLGILVPAAYAARRIPDMPRTDAALLAAAMAFSMAGDRAMLVEEFSPLTSADERKTLPASDPLTAKDRRLAWGATLFSGAQLAYCALLWRRGARPHVATVLPRVAILAESATVIAYHRPRLLQILGPYGNTLAMMSALAADSPTARTQLRLGGALFLASDLTILNRRHLLSNPVARRLAEVWVLASYFAAQALLIDGLSRPAGDGN